MKCHMLLWVVFSCFMKLEDECVSEINQVSEEFPAAPDVALT